MWEALRDRHDNALTKLGCTHAWWKHSASRQSPDDTVTKYFTKLFTFHTKLIGTTDIPTVDAMKAPLLPTLSNSYETTILTLAQQIPAPKAQHSVDLLREYAEWTTLNKDIGGMSTRAALYTHCRHRGCGSGHCHTGNGAGWGARQGNRRQKDKYTYCKMDNDTTEACEKR